MVNLKVAQAVKQAMSLVFDRLDLLMDQRLSDKFQNEAGKNIALEQRITKRIHDLIQGEVAVKMIEQDIKNDLVFEKKKKKKIKKHKLSQEQCVNIKIEQSNGQPASKKESINRKHVAGQQVN